MEMRMRSVSWRLRSVIAPPSMSLVNLQIAMIIIWRRAEGLIAAIVPSVGGSTITSVFCWEVRVRVDSIARCIVRLTSAMDRVDPSCRTASSSWS